MTTEHINIAIAEACGWEVAHSHEHSPFATPESELWHLLHNGLIKEVFHWGNPVVKMSNPTLKDCASSLPDYCGDLSAMHEAEQTLLGKVGWTHYSQVLLHGNIHAEACQRAEAFLRTIGKWKE